MLSTRPLRSAKPVAPVALWLVTTNDPSSVAEPCSLQTVLNASARAAATPESDGDERPKVPVAYLDPVRFRETVSFAGALLRPLLEASASVKLCAKFATADT